jgi:hypothetical protein
MPPVPATAEVLPIQMDRIFKLEVEVLSPTPEPMVRFVATEDRLGPPSTLTAAPVTVRRVKLTGFWPPSPAPAPLTRAFNMLEVVEPDNADRGGRTLPKGKMSAVELAETPEL